MLPFPPSDGGSSRKFQCFICGCIFPEYEEFKQHILGEHDEGREFMTCPLKHCGCPVRDMRAHFRAKHPHTALPSGIQLKAQIMYDQRSQGRKKKVSFAEGMFRSDKNGKDVHYRSGYELKVYKILERMGEVSAYHAEPYEIEYFFKGEQRTYIPDLLVYFVDGRQELWEIKPANQTGLQQNKAKWNAAKAHCLTRGIKFEVITEQGINKMANQVRYTE